jgi:glutathione S-transferase
MNSSNYPEWLIPATIASVIAIYILTPSKKPSFKSKLTTLNDTKVIVFGGPQKTSYPNGSPFVSKLIAFLVHNGIPYEFRTTTNYKESPNGKIPFIHYKGQILSDSNFIIRLLIADGLAKDPNAKLKPNDLALSEMIRQAFESLLYWGIVMHAWINNWETTKEEYFGEMPLVLKWVLPDKVIRPIVLKNLKAVGVTRYEQGQYDTLVKEFIQNASAILGSKKYFMGDEITLLDYTAFAQLGNIFYLSHLAPELKEELVKYSNLVKYIERLTPLFKPKE